MFTVRVHCKYVNDVTELFKSPLDQLFLVKEIDASRAHYQGLIKYENKIASLRQLLKYRCPELKGNGGYSVKQTSGEVDDYITYLCKGTSSDGPEIVINNLGIEDIDERYVKYWEKNKELKKKLGLVERIVGDSFVLCNNHEDVTRLTRHIIEYYHEQGRIINKVQIRNMVITYLSKHDRTYKERLINEISSDIRNPR